MACSNRLFACMLEWEDVIRNELQVPKRKGAMLNGWLCIGISSLAASSKAVGTVRAMQVGM